MATIDIDSALRDRRSLIVRDVGMAHFYSRSVVRSCGAAYPGPVSDFQTPHFRQSQRQIFAARRSYTHRFYISALQPHTQSTRPLTKCLLASF